MSSRRVISDQGPSVVERAHGFTLEAWVKAHLEPVAESETRRRAVENINTICKQWIHFTMVTGFNLPSGDYGGRLFATGSYRHNVHSSGSDIDMVLIAPSRITRQHFFTTLVARLRDTRAVKDLTFAEEAVVPIISFKYDGVDIDLSLVAIRQDHVPDNIDMLDDRIHIGLDEHAVRSVNAVRDAQLLLDLVPQTAVFRQALRFIKNWAKTRGIHGAKLGCTSGIGWAIMVAKICQLYPNQNAAGVVFRFFRVYKQWFRLDVAGKANSPVYITDSLTPETVIAGVPRSWSPANPRDATALYPVITPAYPFQNSCFTVSRTTLGMMLDEFTRAHDILAEWMDATAEEAPALAEAAGVQTGVNNPRSLKVPASAETFPFGVWSRVLQPYNVFDDNFKYYLHSAVAATSADTYDSWVDFVESKLRLLWTEQNVNRGAALECYPEVRLRVITRRFEDPTQQAVLARLKDAAVSAQRGSGLSGTAMVSPQHGPADPLSPLRSASGGTPDARLSGATRSSAGRASTVTTPLEFVAHFYFGIAMDGKAPGGQPARVPNLDAIRSALHLVCRPKQVETTKLPTVEIVRAAELPSWLPLPAKPCTANEAAETPDVADNKPLPAVPPVPLIIDPLEAPTPAASTHRPRPDGTITKNVCQPVPKQPPVPQVPEKDTDTQELLGLDF